MGGFSGASAVQTRPSCRSFRGHNFCGTSEPHVSELACGGQEAEAMDCPFEQNDDVFCAPEESVIVRCVGDGDTQGRPMKAAAPQTEVAPFAPMLSLGCDSTLLSVGMGSSMPGTSFLGVCSASCDASPVTVAGSSIYTSGS